MDQKEKRHHLNQLLQTLPAYRVSGSNNLLIHSIVSDNRQVQPGSLFVAYQGLYQDGHAFVHDAIRRGAAAVVIEAEASLDLPNDLTVLQVPNGREALAHLAAAWHGYPGQQMTVIGVTGTDGKTSTINLIYAILKAAGHKVGMISTVNAIIDDTVLDTGLHVTTPDAPDIQRLMAQMVAAGVEICLLESTSHGLAQHRVTACDFDLAVVTNITHEHLNHHNNSLEEYRLAKARLFDALAQRAAILNKDDWSFNFLRERIGGRLPIIDYSLTDAALVSAHDITLTPSATEFTLRLAGQVDHLLDNNVGVSKRNAVDYTSSATASSSSQSSIEDRYAVASPLVGAFNVSNMLAALATTIQGLGIEPQTAIAALRAFKGVPGRMERIDEGQPFTAIVDFAHAPNSLQRALETARSLTDGRVIAVFGCAGERDVEKRTMMGYIAAALADITVITAEDPRTEDVDIIIATTAQALREKGAVENETFYCLPDRGRAIYFATQLAQPGDIVIALGKGHEQSMCFGSTEYSWDDRKAMRTALRGTPLLTLPTQGR